MFSTVFIDNGKRKTFILLKLKTIWTLLIFYFIIFNYILRRWPMLTIFGYLNIRLII